VLSLLPWLRARRDVRLGLLTGNYPETGLLKLRVAGIEPSWFEVAAWGDMAATRPALVPLALAQLPLPAVHARDVIVIGDTPRDVHCAKENGALCVAVATGGNTRAELEDSGADLVLDDLRDGGPILRLAFGLDRSTAPRAAE
jgi:phosphoglycolate phosphatase-like HAD superfamily hydrolase